MSERKAVTFDVPMGTPPRRCDGCSATIFWVVTATGKRMPVDCNQPEGRAPTDASSGTGISHFATCPNAASFRKRR